jgi:zinc and cadmium transporter
MDPFFIMLISVFATALLSISGGVILLFGRGKAIEKVKKIGPFFAFVILLYAVFGDIIPEILEEEELTIPDLIGLVGVGFVAATLIGHFMGHFHHHSDACIHDAKTIKSKTQAYTMLAVDSVHAIADGIVLGTSFIANPSTGLSACLATVAHEIPQEIGDFDIYMRAKIAKKKILKLQTLSSLIIVPAACLSYFVGNELLESLPSVLAVVAGFLLYVAFGELLVILGQIRAIIK